jgi:NAD(P)H-flavin reductase
MTETAGMIPQTVQVVERIQESPTVFTLRVRYSGAHRDSIFRFVPGQFNMLSLHGVGEVPISIVSDPLDEHHIDHTLRAVGRVTHALARLQAGDRLGLRGPYGRGWPLERARGKDVLIVSGGLGCAPTVSVINYVVRRRRDFGRLVIMQGVKHADDLIWREQYAEWARMPDTQVLVAADKGASLWPWRVGQVTQLFDEARIDPGMTTAMLCGPEGMMRAALDQLLAHGLSQDALWLSVERSMHCATGLCGHCQIGGRFVCRDGPVFCYKDIKDLLGQRGF